MLSLVISKAQHGKGFQSLTTTLAPQELTGRTLRREIFRNLHPGTKYSITMLTCTIYVSNPGNSSMCLKGLALISLCMWCSIWFFRQAVSLVISLLHTDISAHKLRQGGELIALNAAALYPLVNGNCNWDSRAEQFKLDVKQRHSLLWTTTGYQSMYSPLNLIIYTDLTLMGQVNQQLVAWQHMQYITA